VTLRPYAIPDWIKLHGYAPPANIVALAEDNSMTDAARHLLYINHSTLEGKTAFRQSCPSASEKTIIIGCYEQHQKGIHILAVDDQRLMGVEQVTAAHEMLHAAYERLSSDDKKRINTMLADYQKNGLKDQRVLGAIESYKKTEPGQELNEIHSMFGTEIADLPVDLETYYAQYFTDRQKVVGFADSYQDAFTSRESAIETYDTDLKTQETQIKANTRSLEEQEKSLEDERDSLDSLRRQGEVAVYNAGVLPFNQAVAAYNKLLADTRAMIEQYNALVAKRNAIAAQTVELQKAIDSSSLPGSQ
jgi:uncharacterized protein YukE